MLDGIWSGGTYAIWGTDNREAPIRLCGAPGSHHFELKSSDATANPYLALAGVIDAGVLGIEQRTPLTIGDCAKTAFLVSETERKAVGLENPGRLPKTIHEARSLLLANKELSQILGEDFVQRYVAVNEVRCPLHSDFCEAHGAVLSQLLGLREIPACRHRAGKGHSAYRVPLAENPGGYAYRSTFV